MDKQAIVRNFSRFANFYDDYADMQKRAAGELAHWIQVSECRRILEIGCGTGNYSLLLRDRFKYSAICCLDISEKMIQKAKDKLQDGSFEFLSVDAEDFTTPQEFDLITSNACLQWFEDLGAALVRYKEMLTPGGWVYFSIFGPRTFEELAGAMTACLQDKAIPSAAFLPREAVEAILRENFHSVQVREEIYHETFSCLRDLLEKIRYTGIRGGSFALGRGMLGPRKLKAIEQAYLERHKQITTTYQVFFCRGVKG